MALTALLALQKTPGKSRDQKAAQSPAHVDGLAASAAAVVRQLCSGASLCTWLGFQTDGYVLPSLNDLESLGMLGKCMMSWALPALHDPSNIKVLISWGSSMHIMRLAG